VPLVTRFTQLLGCRHPVQQAPMGGMASPALAVAVARAGGLGMLSGAMGHAELAAQLELLGTNRPIGVNFLVPFLDDGALESACGRVPYIEFFWGAPSRRRVDTVHAGGARAGWQVGSVDEALAAVDAGCDLVVAQGVEAGGHVRGTVGLLPLLDGVRGAVSLPVVAAGGIGSGRAMAAALTAGADAVRVGTRFLAASESTAHPAYVDALIRARAEDTVVTTAYGDGWPDAPHRVLQSAIQAGQALGAAQVWSPDWPSTEFVGPVEARALYAGQSVGSVRGRAPAATIVAELVDEAQDALARRPDAGDR
jgi:NAD(P)H-dependent flavin oxidoreductase YrpB (nitropropane dioxygenase family)